MNVSTDIQIPNHHGQFGTPEIARDPDQYVSVFENRHGEQFILSVNRLTGEGYLATGDMEWDLLVVSENGLQPGIDFEDDELAWYTSCWMAILHKPFVEIAGMLEGGTRE